MDNGEYLNLDQITVPLASYPRVYVIQWVEMGLEREPEELKENQDYDLFAYRKGLQRWFHLFYNSST